MKSGQGKIEELRMTFLPLTFPLSLHPIEKTVARVPYFLSAFRYNSGSVLLLRKAEERGSQTGSEVVAPF